MDEDSGKNPPSKGNQKKKGNTMFSKILLLVGCCAIAAHAELSCLDEAGKPVDWFIVYKLPRQADGPAPLNTGFSYGFMTSSDKKKAFKLSDKLVTDEESIFGKTLAPLYSNPKAYSNVMYNDAPPHGAGELCLERMEQEMQ